MAKLDNKPQPRAPVNPDRPAELPQQKRHLASPVLKGGTPHPDHSR